jgi:thiamine biosynthesis lipoprotein
LSARAPQLHRERWNAMGTPCELQLFAADPALARRAAERAIADVARLEARYSRYREDSLLSELNRVAARGGALEVDAETAALLDYAASCHRESEGLFDVTSGVLRRAWRFERGEPPDARLVEALLERVGWHRLVWARPRLEFPVAGMELDLGGVVKEYAADRAAALCREAGVASGLVNLGGDIAVVGPRPGGAPWRIGIRHPRDPNALVGSVELERGALASSGDYARCIVHEGVRYGHILNPRTGWPVRELASVSVASELCVVAGSAATIAMLYEERGAAWLERTGLPSHWVDVRGATGGSLAA